MTEQGARIKFRSYRLGALNVSGVCEPLAKAIREMEQRGYMPVLADGKPGGNAAMLYLDGLLVSRSSRRVGSAEKNDFVFVERFDPVDWAAYYHSSADEIEPTSDTPLYWAALKQSGNESVEQPLFALHGHAFETPEAAEKLGVPISHAETTFSTPEDAAALRRLMADHPYPAFKVYIRRGHGFFVLGADADDAIATMCRLRIG